MSLSSDLEPPQELVKTETSTLITSTYFDSSFKMLQSHINDLFTNQQKRVTLATLTNVYPNEVFTSQQSQTTLTTLNNVYRDDDFQQSSQSESETENEDVTKENRKTRKRKRNVENSKRNYTKCSRNSGKEYVNWKGNTQAQRKLKPPCENCRNNCTKKISEEDRVSIFSNFWSLADINRQRDFISKFTCLEEKKRCRIRPKPEVDENVQSRRKSTFTYFLLSGGKRIMVCKKFFLNTLSISGQMVATVYSKMSSSGTVVEDRRGKSCKNSLLDESVKNSKYVIKIRHTFLEPGHTQNEGDCVHSVIERAARNIPIYTPEQWCSVVRTAKRKKPFYTVYELTQKDVFDLRKLQSDIAINFDKDVENRKVFVSKFKILEFDPKFPNFLFFKINYEDEQFTRLNLIERGRKSLGEFDINSIELKPLFTSKIPVPKKKYDHLQFLCVKCAITPHYHDYFKQLPFTNKSVNEEGEDN
nr:unnamed protein product [Callosobruchus chinensis]